MPKIRIIETYHGIYSALFKYGGAARSSGSTSAGEPIKVESRTPGPPENVPVVIPNHAWPF
jgi:thiamine biosynthesis lipoprotein ApbE